jgi:serine/threonine-protein kinase
MGRVDLVARRDGAFFRLFALKRLKPELAHDSVVRGMFLDEARIAGLLHHPNVVSVVDVGEDRDGPFLLMEFVEGISVAQLIASASARNEQLPVELCLGIARHAALGLEAAHDLRAPDGTALGLVHRDVSPQNILVGFDGVARVTDFGIAKALGRVSKTSTGVLKGKLGYLSPEQLRFEMPDRRSDLFSLGVVLFEMLSGQRLYDSTEDMDGPRRILNEPPPDIAEHRDDVEPEVVELLFELLAKEPQHRPNDAGEVARRLDGILVAASATSQRPFDSCGYLKDMFAHEREALHSQIAQASSSRWPPPSSRWRRTSTWSILTVLAMGAAFPLARSAQRQKHLAFDPATESIPRPPEAPEGPTTTTATPNAPSEQTSPVASASGGVAAPQPPNPRPRSHRGAKLTKASAGEDQPPTKPSATLPVWENY